MNAVKKVASECGEENCYRGCVESCDKLMEELMDEIN